MIFGVVGTRERDGTPDSAPDGVLLGTGLGSIESAPGVVLDGALDVMLKPLLTSTKSKPSALLDSLSSKLLIEALDSLSSFDFSESLGSVCVILCLLPPKLSQLPLTELILVVEWKPFTGFWVLENPLLSLLLSRIRTYFVDLFVKGLAIVVEAR